MASRFNPFSAAKRVFNAARRLLPGGKQPPAEKITPPTEVTPPERLVRPPSPGRPSPGPRSGERAPNERAIMSIISALHATGVTDSESHNGDAIEALQDDLGLAGASEILREQLESTRAYIALARSLGRAPRVGESQPGNERWHERDSKYAGLKRSNGGSTLHIPNWYDKFFFYHGSNY